MSEPRRRNGFTAFEAIAELTCINPLERSLDRDALGVAAPRLRQRHCLNLHRVDARQASDAVLVESNRRAVSLSQSVLLDQRLMIGDESRA